MKTTSRYSWYIPILFINMFIFFSCNKDNSDTPEDTNPKLNFEANISIANLKGELASGETYKLITDNYIIKGKVISSDKNGNFNNLLVIQDETTGLHVRIDKNNSYLDFPIGQEVYISCKGLALGSTNSVIQLGYPVNNQIFDIPETLVTNFILCNGQPTSVVPQEITSSSYIDISQYEVMLVKLTNVSFERAGQVLIPGSEDYDNIVKFSDGSSIIMSTPIEASFAKEILPRGHGNIIGIMSRFGSTPIIKVCLWENIQNFTGGNPNPSSDYPSPNLSATALDSLTVGFDGATVDQPIDVTGWVNVALKGSRTWQGKDFGGNQYAQATAYKATESMITWLLSAPVKYNSAHKLSFKSAIAYWTHTTMTPMKVYLMYNYDVNDPSSAVWTQLTPTLPTSAGPNYTFIESGSIALKDYVPTGYTGNIYVAFRYEGDASQTTTFQVDDVKIGKGGNGGGGSTTLFDEQFTSTLGSFKAFSVVGTQAWAWASFGSGCAKMSGYATVNNENEDWLVSPAIDLSNKVGAILNVSQAANYVNGHPEFLKILASSDYNGTSDPSTQGTWVELTVPTWPAGNNWNFVDSGDIDLSAFNGKSKVYIAFKYNSTSSIGSTWEIGSVTVK